MRMDKLTSRFQQALADAQSLAVGRDHNLIEPAHVLLALLDQQGGSTRPMLAQAGVNAAALRQRLGEALDKLPKVSGQAGDVSVGNDLARLLNLSDKLAQQRGDAFIASELFVLAALEDKGEAGAALKAAGAKKEALEKAIDDDVEDARKFTPGKHQAEFDAIRSRMGEAVKTIKTSKLGQTTGRSALYELPWYMVIGNPAAGKSTAVVKSGLKFPFADNAGNIIQGIGGTRNCDWFFTTEGILLDTAGRYSVHEEDRGEWLGFLSLLKKHRPKAPLNGVIIAVSIAELVNQKADLTIELAGDDAMQQRLLGLSLGAHQ